MKFLAITGRVYIVGLFLCVAFAALYLIGAGILSEWRTDFIFFMARPYLEYFFIAFVHGLAAWGLMRRKPWSNEFSIALCLLWTAVLIMSAMNLDGDYSNWQAAIPIAFVLPAAAWLLSPAAKFRVRRTASV